MKAGWQINNETKIRQVRNIDVTDIDGEKVMMDLEQGYYFMLNQVASRIWDLSEETTTVREIVANLLKEYDIEEVECKEQVVSFIEELLEKQLVTIESA